MAAGLLAATAALAADPPTSCTTSEYRLGDPSLTTPPWTLSLVGGPTLVSCSSPSGQCTEIEYELSGSTQPDSVTVLTGLGLARITGGTAPALFAPCVGEPFSLVGRFSCHEQAARMTPPPSFAMDGSVRFKVAVDGQRKLASTSVVVRKVKAFGACRIAGLTGEALNPFLTLTKSEILKFKACSAKFDFNIATGELMGDPVLVDSPESCQLRIRNIDQLELILGELSLGFGQTGFGIISTGTASCTTRVIGGRVYSWGDSCD